MLAMAGLDYRTAGESHGAAVVVLIEGLPAGVRLDLDAIDTELRQENDRLAASGLALRLERRGGRLALRGPLPCPRATGPRTGRWFCRSCRSSTRRNRL